MPVNVTISDPDAPKEHDTGFDIAVSDGHLWVLAGDHHSKVAVYAPGSWASAEVIKK